MSAIGRGPGIALGKQAGAAHDAAMRRPSHPRRRGSRDGRLLRRFASAFTLVLGTAVLAAFLWVTPASRIVLLGAAALLALYALVRLSHLAGRAAAAVYNFVALQSGRSGFEKIFHEQHRGRHV